LTVEEPSECVNPQRPVNHGEEPSVQGAKPEHTPSSSVNRRHVLII
jgi:hypothetical protein